MTSALSSLVSVAEADRILAAYAEESGGTRPAEAVPLETAAGRVLREDIRADRAYPAQDRSRMDGIAVRGDDPGILTSGCVVAGLARAGAARLDTPPRGTCVEIMTGAALPQGCDTVIPYEDLHITGGADDAGGGSPRTATVRDGATVRGGQFVHREGSDCAAGDVLVPAGTRLSAAHIAIAASVGMPTLRVARRFRAAVVATGDELVGVEETPLAHQLRVSNAHGLAALIAPYADARVHRVGDDPAALTAVLRAVLSSFDLVLVSGGVSAGKFDAVPAALESRGVRKRFHKLAQKPGKPLWFGTYQETEQTPGGPHDTALSPEGSSGVASSGERAVPPTNENRRMVPVFGLPGNPVSALVCARRFVLPLLERLLGLNAPEATFVPVEPDVSPSHLTRYAPARLVQRAVSPRDAAAASGLETETVAALCAVNGSGDFAALGASDGFVEVPPSGTRDLAGARMAYFGWSS